jgi:SAM-dependent methyltransferase
VQARLAPAAEALVEASGVSAGSRVLDVAAGTGNVTLAAARRGAHVTASDIAPAMIEKGRARTAAAGLDIQWLEADAQALPFDDGAFDHVLSAFGAMFAPDAARTAQELLRVTASSGTVAVTTWVVGGINSAAADVVARHMPGGPPTPAAREQWGDPEMASSFFERFGATATIERRTLRWAFEDVEDWASYMERGAPPFVAAQQMLGDAAWLRVRADLLATAQEHRTTSDGGFVVEPPYLLIVARR